jgi:hypothetical protein
MIASSPEPRLRDIVDAIGYIRSDLDQVTLESTRVAADVLWRVVQDDLGTLEQVCRVELAALPPDL